MNMRYRSLSANIGEHASRLADLEDRLDKEIRERLRSDHESLERFNILLKLFGELVDLPPESIPKSERKG